MSLKDKTAIIGIADLKPTKSTEETSLELTAKVAKMAIEDAGLDKGEIDGLLTASGPETMWASQVGEHIGLYPYYSDVVDMGGASACGMVWRAAAAINAGVCHAVLCVAASGGRERGSGRLAVSIRAEFENPYGPMGGANSGYALLAQRHIYEYGTTSEQLAKIAVDQRTNACANPDAMFYGQPITIADVLNSPLISDPLHMLDIVMPCSGGSAFIITSADRAKRTVQPPVWLLGAGEYRTHYSIVYAPSLTTTPAKGSAEMAFRMAQVTPKQIDLVEPYDCYTIIVLATLEDAGFCQKGQGGKFVEETDLTYKGQLPCNTFGGQLSFGQVGEGMPHITEACRQLMGRGGARQVANPKLAFVNGNGGVMSEHCSLILGI